MEDNAGTSKTSPPARATSSPAPGQQRSSSASALETGKTGPDMDLPRHPLPQYETNAPTTPKGDAADSRTSTFRGPGGSPIVERSSPMQHRPYPSSSSAMGDVRREPSSMSPTLTRQGVDTQQQRMLPPPSPPTQRHQLGYTGMDLPPLSSLTSSLPHRPPSSGGGAMPISSLLGSVPPSNDTMSMHSHHHHHSSHHHHHRPPRPYTPEYGNPLGPPSSTSNPLSGNTGSQSTPTTPAVGYPDMETSSHGRSSSYGRLPSNAGMLPTPFRDGPPHRSYMSRDPVRDDYFPRQRDILNVDHPSSPSPQHLPDMPKSSSAYPHPKNSGPSATVPPPLPPAQHHHHQPQSQQPQHQPIPQPLQPLSLPQQPQQTPSQQSQPSSLSLQPASSHLMSQSSHSQSSRPTTNGSSVPRTNSHHHHHRPVAQPITRQPPTPQPRPQPKVIINNSPALDAVAHIRNKPFLGRFIYQPGWIIPASVVQDAIGGKFEVRIAQRFLNRDNEGVVRRKLWGSGVYTDDSDVVAILFHQQVLSASSLSPPKDIAAHFTILPTLKHYAPSTFNEIRSRGWKIHDGYSIYLDKFEWLDLGSADGGWRGRKRRLDEEYRMGADDEVVGMNRAEVVFKGVNWEAEPFVSNKRNGEGQRVGVSA